MPLYYQGSDQNKSSNLSVRNSLDGRMMNSNMSKCTKACEEEMHFMLEENVKLRQELKQLRTFQNMIVHELKHPIEALSLQHKSLQAKFGKL